MFLLSCCLSRSKVKLWIGVFLSLSIWMLKLGHWKSFKRSLVHNFRILNIVLYYHILHPPRVSLDTISECASISISIFFRILTKWPIWWDMTCHPISNPNKLPNHHGAGSKGRNHPSEATCYRLSYCTCTKPQAVLKQFVNLFYNDMLTHSA